MHFPKSTTTALGDSPYHRKRGGGWQTKDGIWNEIFGRNSVDEQLKKCHIQVVWDNPLLILLLQLLLSLPVSQENSLFWRLLCSGIAVISSNLYHYHRLQWYRSSPWWWGVRVGLLSPRYFTVGSCYLWSRWLISMRLWVCCTVPSTSQSNKLRGLASTLPFKP